MARSPVKSGQYDQRSRATTRRRDRNQKEDHLPNPTEELRAWLREHVPVDSLEDLRGLKPKLYLQQTASFAVTPGERLRQLAIHAEFEATRVSQPEGWSVLRAIYEQARKFEPDCWHIWHSTALSALEVARWATFPPGSEARGRILADGIEAATRAVELAPQEGATHSILGQCYRDVDRLEDALRTFEAGVAVDAKYGWPHLYRAQCLRDLGRFREAVHAYAAVPLDFFKGRHAYRVDLLKEQRAGCQLQAGDHEGALAAFLALLARYEAQPGLAHAALGTDLVRAAAGPLRGQLRARTLALVQQLGFEALAAQLEGA